MNNCSQTPKQSISDSEYLDLADEFVATQDLIGLSNVELLTMMEERYLLCFQYYCSLLVYQHDLVSSTATAAHQLLKSLPTACEDSNPITLKSPSVQATAWL